MPVLGGVFDTQYGTLSVSEFSWFAVAIKKVFHKDKSYHAQVFITCKEERDRRMHLIVVQSLNVCLSVITDY